MALLVSKELTAILEEYPSVPGLSELLNKIKYHFIDSSRRRSLFDDFL